MGYRATHHRRLPTLVGTGLLLGLLGSACGGNSTADEHGSGGVNDVDDLRGSVQAGLLRAQSCDDLLEKLQADAIIKVHLEAAQRLADFLRYTKQVGSYRDAGAGIPVDDGDWTSGPIPGGEVAPSLPPTSSNGGNAGDEFEGGDVTQDSDSGDGDSGGLGGGVRGEGPTGASETNNQVEGVDEADFVKVVRMGEAMFVLQGNMLYKLTTWPAASTALAKGSLKIEGSPSEMFITDGGKAVVFSTVNSYGNKYGGGVDPDVGVAGPETRSAMNALVACPSPGGFEDAAYGCGYYQPITKITVADVSGDAFETEREFYYEGSYLSSRRYGDVVRVVLQAQGAYSFLEYVDYWVYNADYTESPIKRVEFQAKLDAAVDKAEASIRKTKIGDWLPSVQEAKDGKLADLPPACNNFYVPLAGLSGYGLTHVLSMDTAHGSDPGGVTIMGSAQTVYSNLDSLVLAQPDYRWGPAVDFGFVDEQKLNVHLFSIDRANTTYEASGTVSGNLPLHNPQFGIDKKGDVLRLATTGRVRANPDADPESMDFWRSDTTNQIYTMQQAGKLLKVLGKSAQYGHAGESTQSARFVGDRAYVVTFLQTDPVVALDVSDPAQPKVLGEIEIPGFGQYMHPLDQNHIITIGQSGDWGVQLQLFDVTDPTKGIPAPKTLDFGSGSSSEAQHNHKALTFFAEQNLLAMPLYSYGDGYYSSFSSTLQLIKVDANTGFASAGAVDHSGLFEQGSCVRCQGDYCYYACYDYSPEVRRGHFVTSDDATYVYSFSYAGVIVNDLSNLDEDLATVSLPQPVWEGTTWYGTYGGGGMTNAGGGADGSPPPSGTGSVPQDAGAAMPGDMASGGPSPEG